MLTSEIMMQFYIWISLTTPILFVYLWTHTYCGYTYEQRIYEVICVGSFNDSILRLALGSHWVQINSEGVFCFSATVVSKYFFNFGSKEIVSVQFKNDQKHSLLYL